MSSYRDLILRDNPVGYWRLDEPFGALTFNDHTGNGHTGTVTSSNSQAGLGFPGLVASDPRTAMQNRGPTSSTGTLNAPSALITPRNNSFALECWVIMDAGNTGSNEIIGCDNGSGAGRFFQFRLKNQVLQMELNPGLGGQVDINTTAFFNDGKLHHLVFSYNGQTGGTWVDGALAAGAVVNQAITLQTGSHSLGFMTSLPGITGITYNGQLSDVAFYPYALSAEQIQLHYATGVGSRPNIILPAIVSAGGGSTVNKSDSDTGTVTETSATVAVAKTDSDTPSLADFPASLVASTTASDAASETEAAPAGAISSTDSGTLTDSGTVSDAIPPPAPAADTFTLSSTGSIATAVSSSDSGTLTATAAAVVPSVIAQSDTDTATLTELGSNESGGIGSAFNGVCIAFDDTALTVSPTWTRLDDPAGIA